MLAVHGHGIGTSIAIGRALVLSRARPLIPSYTLAAEQIDAECARFIQAISDVRSQLRKLRQSLPSSAPAEIATLIGAHLLMLDDPLLCEEPLETIKVDAINAERALEIQSKTLIDAFDALEDDYLRSKRSDVDQVVTRVQNALLGVSDESPDEDIDTGMRILITEDITPADATLLRDKHISGFVTDLGGPVSHTAILARSLNIPAIVGMHGGNRAIKNDELIIVDAANGVVLIDPVPQVIEEYQQRRQAGWRRLRSLLAVKQEHTRSADGHNVTLLANIELSLDVRKARQVDAEGVGLYRTEYLFMNRADPPDEEEQFMAYADVVKQLNKPITIRTLDLGADKQLDGNQRGQRTATNPAMGLRAIRLCLSRPDLFVPQLRAILRASAFGPVELMLPMVTSIDELEQVLTLIEDTKYALRLSRIAYDSEIRIGGMIEVPAAALTARSFAEKLDFLSIGTNDLIQYTLAIDRIDDDVTYLYEPLHPAVLQLIKMVIDAGHAANVPVSMCGEMAGDSRYTRLLLGMGLRVFSMDPRQLLEIKQLILHSNTDHLQAKATNVLRESNADSIRTLVNELNA